MQTRQDKLTKLTPEELISLTSGADFWKSVAISEKQIPSFRMSDGPNGLRYQASAGDALGINESAISTCFPLQVRSLAPGTLIWYRKWVRQLGWKPAV